MEHGGLTQQRSRQTERLAALADDPDDAALGQGHLDRRQLEPAVLGQHDLGLGPGGVTVGQSRAERHLAVAGGESQEVVVERAPLPQPRVGRGGAAGDLGEVREGLAAARELLLLTRGDVAPERPHLVLVVTAVAPGAASRLPALLQPAADHHHRAEEAEQREQDVLEHEHHHHPEDERAERRGEAEARPGGLLGLLGRGEDVVTRRRAVARRAVEGDGPRQVRLAHRVHGQAGNPRRDDEGHVAGLEHRLGLNVGGLADALALHPRAVDRFQVSDGGPQAARAGLDAQMAAGDALVAEREIAVAVAAHDDAARGQRHRPTGVEAGDDPQLEDSRRGLERLGGAIGRLDARPLVEADLGEGEVDVAEAPVDHDAASLGGIGQRVEQVADRGVLASEPELHVLWPAGVVVEYDAHLCAAEATDGVASRGTARSIPRATSGAVRAV